MADIQDTYIRLTQKAFNSLVATVRTIKKKTDLYPDLTPTLGNGDTYAFRNGALEMVCEDGNDVMFDAKITATTLAQAALEKGEIPKGYPQEMYEEVREILGDEIFNDFAVRSGETLELHPELTAEEKIEQLKTEYLQRKAEIQAMVEQMKREAELAREADVLESGKSELDVEHDKIK